MILGRKSGVFYQWRCRLKLLLSCGPMLVKTEKNVKNPKFQISLFFEQLW